VFGSALGAEADAQDANERFRRTPLHFAARSDVPPEIVQLLIAAGGDPEQQDVQGNTPLHFAAIYSTRRPGCLSCS
jgi:ankyrin repeat protein